MRENANPGWWSGWRRLLGWTLLAAALALLCWRYPLDSWLLARSDWIRASGWRGVALFSVVYVLCTLLLVPGGLLTMAAGLVFGLLRGTAVVVVAATLGAGCAFLIGRHLARGAVARRVAARPRLAALDRAVALEGFRIVFLTRLSPVFPFVLLNYAYGVSGVRFGTYLAASLLGMIPGTVAYVYLGTLVTSLAELTSGAPPGTNPWLYWSGLVVTLAVTGYVTRVAARALRTCARD